MTRDEIVEYVRQRLTADESDTALETQVIGEINRVYKRVALMERLSISRGSVSLTADDPVGTLPSDCGELIRLRKGNQTLNPITWQEFTETEAQIVDLETTLTPYAYVVLSDTQIRVLPTPDEAMTLTVDYAVRPSDLSSSTDTPSLIPEEYHDLIAEYALEKMALREEEPGLAATAKANGDLALGALRAHIIRRRGDRTLKRTIRGQVARG